jgi:hypothetical protein
MKNISIVYFMIAGLVSTYGQVINKTTLDTADFAFQGKVTFEGYIDTYYAYNFNRPASKDQPYMVSMARDREVNINLAFIEMKYSSSRLRARFVPGFGTYMNTNYAAEKGTLKNIVESSAGIKISSKKNIWIDAGIFGSPYTNESAISKGQLAYTRSFAPEYVPYYLAGVKASVPLSPKVNAYFYLLNGWQQIQDQNDHLAVGTQLEFRPTEYLLLNWDTYIGDEQSVSDSTIGKRYFSDIYLVYSRDNFSFTTCAYAGVQEQAESNATWWQANFIARYNLTRKLSATGRIEYFSDPHQVHIIPMNGSGFNTSSGSIGLNYKLGENVLIRLEGRTFLSNQDVYSRNNEFVNNSTTLTSNITMWF